MVASFINRIGTAVPAIRLLNAFVEYASLLLLPTTKTDRYGPLYDRFLQAGRRDLPRKARSLSREPLRSCADVDDGE